MLRRPRAPAQCSVRPQHGSQHPAGLRPLHAGAARPALPGGGQVVGGLPGPGRRPGLQEPAAARIHGLTLHRRDAAAPPAGETGAVPPNRTEPCWYLSCRQREKLLMNFGLHHEEDIPFISN